MLPGINGQHREKSRASRSSAGDDRELPVSLDGWTGAADDARGSSSENAISVASSTDAETLDVQFLLDSMAALEPFPWLLELMYETNALQSKKLLRRLCSEAAAEEYRRRRTEAARSAAERRAIEKQFEGQRGAFARSFRAAAVVDRSDPAARATAEATPETTPRDGEDRRISSRRGSRSSIKSVKLDPMPARPGATPVTAVTSSPKRAGAKTGGRGKSLRGPRRRAGDGDMLPYGGTAKDRKDAMREKKLRSKAKAGFANHSLSGAVGARGTVVPPSTIGSTEGRTPLTLVDIDAHWKRQQQKHEYDSTHKVDDDKERIEAAQKFAIVHGTKAAISIQRVWRGYKGRLRFDECWWEYARELAAIRIQSRARGMAARAEVKSILEEHAAGTIGAVARGWQGRRRVRHMREDIGARELQRVVRGRQSRRRTRRLERAREQNRAAVKIQAQARGKIERERVKTHRKNVAATKVQRIARGRKARSDLVHYRETTMPHDEGQLRFRFEVAVHGLGGGLSAGVDHGESKVAAAEFGMPAAGVTSPVKAVDTTDDARHFLVRAELCWWLPPPNRSAPEPPTEADLTRRLAAVRGQGRKARAAERAKYLAERKAYHEAMRRPPLARVDVDATDLDSGTGTAISLVVSPERTIPLLIRTLAAPEAREISRRQLSGELLPFGGVTARDPVTRALQMLWNSPALRVSFEAELQALLSHRAAWPDPLADAAAAVRGLSSLLLDQWCRCTEAPNSNSEAIAVAVCLLMKERPAKWSTLREVGLERGFWERMLSVDPGEIRSDRISNLREAMQPVTAEAYAWAGVNADVESIEDIPLVLCVWLSELCKSREATGARPATASRASLLRTQSGRVQPRARPGAITKAVPTIASAFAEAGLDGDVSPLLGLRRSDWEKFVAIEDLDESLMGPVIATCLLCGVAPQWTKARRFFKAQSAAARVLSGLSLHAVDPEAGAEAHKIATGPQFFARVKDSGQVCLVGLAEWVCETFSIPLEPAAFASSRKLARSNKDATSRNSKEATQRQGRVDSDEEWEEEEDGLAAEIAAAEAAAKAEERARAEAIKAQAEERKLLRARAAKALAARELAKALDPSVKSVSVTSVKTLLSDDEVASVVAAEGPPAGSELTVAMVCLILNLEPTWGAAREVFVSGHAPDRLASVKPANLTDDTWKKLRAVGKNADSLLESARLSRLTAIEVLAKWVLGVYEEARITRKESKWSEQMKAGAGSLMTASSRLTDGADGSGDEEKAAAPPLPARQESRLLASILKQSSPTRVAAFDVVAEQPLAAYASLAGVGVPPKEVAAVLGCVGLLLGEDSAWAALRKTVAQPEAMLVRMARLNPADVPRKAAKKTRKLVRMLDIVDNAKKAQIPAVLALAFWVEAVAHATKVAESAS